MKHLHSIVYHKLSAQAEEARERNLVKLAERIEDTLHADPVEELEEYSFAQMKEDIHKDLWKSAARVIAHYNLQSADAEKVDQAVVRLAEKVLSELENALGTDHILVGAMEPKVPGENK